MKAYLSFNLNTEDDKYAYRMAIDGHKYARALDECFELLRKYIKYESDEFTKTQIALLEKIREELYEIKRTHLEDNL